MMKKPKLTISPQLLPVPGARVGIVCGPGQFPADAAGTVLCHVTNRWGTHAVVLMDGGGTRAVHGLTSVGIGTYLLRGHAHPAGYTDEFVASTREHSLRILARPDADFDAEFLAWDLDSLEFITMSGWLWSFERIEPAAVPNQERRPRTS